MNNENTKATIDIGELTARKVISVLIKTCFIHMLTISNKGEKYTDVCYLGDDIGYLFSYENEDIKIILRSDLNIRFIFNEKIIDWDPLDIDQDIETLLPLDESHLSPLTFGEAIADYIGNMKISEFNKLRCAFRK